MNTWKMMVKAIDPKGNGGIEWVVSPQAFKAVGKPCRVVGAPTIGSWLMLIPISKLMKKAFEQNLCQTK